MFPFEKNMGCKCISSMVIVHTHSLRNKFREAHFGVLKMFRIHFLTVLHWVFSTMLKYCSWKEIESPVKKASHLVFCNSSSFASNIYCYFLLFFQKFLTVFRIFLKDKTSFLYHIFNMENLELWKKELCFERYFKQTSAGFWVLWKEGTNFLLLLFK